MTATAAGPGTRARLLPVQVAVAAVFSGQQLLTPLLPALAARLDLPATAVGVVVSTAAAIGLVLSPWYGRRCGRWGLRRTLVAAVSGSGAALVAVAAGALAGLAGVLGATACLVVLVLTRGVLFGVACAAVPVAAQAYVAARTPDPDQRVRGIAALGACVGVGVVVGPSLGGVVAAWGLEAALVAPAVPVLVAACWLLVAAPPAAPAPAAATAASIRPTDPRIRSSLVLAFGSFLTLTASQVTLGFLVQDRFGLDPGPAAQLTGVLLVALGGGFVVTQLVVVPRLGWAPRRLIAVGTPLGAAAFAALVVVPGAVALGIALGVSGIALALAVAGFMSEPTLLVPDELQGPVAGLLAAADGLAFVVGPLVATTLFALAPEAPYVACAALLAVLTVYAVVRPHPQTGDRP